MLSSNKGTGMANFHVLTQTYNSTAVYVNADLVRVIRHNDSTHGGTVLVFDTAQSVTVSEPFEEVAKAFNNADRS
jgi:hypothetical protein